MAFILRAIGVIAVILLIVAAIVVGQDWRLFQRYYTAPGNNDDPANALWFEPRVAIGSGPGAPLAVAAESQRTLPDEALQAAWRYAEDTGTGALIIAYDSVIQLERYGEGVGPDTPFQSQSLHKGLTATALGAAIASGAIPSADTPASTYLSEWAGDPVKRQATLADLAYMQSGMQRPPYGKTPFAPGAQLFFTGKLAERALSTPFVAEPGTVYTWSNASTQSLAVAIERATGETWAEFIGSALWQPMGGGEAYVQLDRPGGTAQAFCCLVSNARNWLRLGELLRNDGVVNGRRILPQGWVDLMTTGGKQNPNYGMQLWVNEPYTGEFLVNGQPRLTRKRGDRLAARDAYFIEGHFAQRLYVVPSAGLVVIRLGDDVTDWDDAPLMNPLIEAAQTARLPTGLPPVPPPPDSFAESAHPPAPDYTQLVNWTAHPDKYDVTDQDPPGQTRPEQPPADAFYINPTTYRGMQWNAAVDDKDANIGVDGVTMSQATVLAECCRIFAPRYRQATSAAVTDPVNGMAAYGFAFQDVRAAFQQFVAQTADRPIVILGHSQGAFHLMRLLSEEITGTPLVDRLVAAYVVGIAVPTGMVADAWSDLTICSEPTSSGCVAAWSTYGPNADALSYQRRTAPRYEKYARADGGIDLLCMNPLTGAADAAPAAANLGAVPIPPLNGYLTAPVPGLVGASCEDGILRTGAALEPPFAALSLPGESYHFYDIALFHTNLRRDTARRVDAWLAEHAN
jgi:CubicO group peptidase (beta-lactamase class C family)